MVLMVLIVGSLVGAVIGGVLVAGSRWFTQPARDVKQIKSENLELKRNYHKALNVLREISADRVGAPQLEAQLVLDELESNHY